MTIAHNVQHPRKCDACTGGLLVGLISLAFAIPCQVDDADAKSAAIGLLRALENSRLATPPVRLRGKVSRMQAGPEWNCDFVIEYESGKYRISSEGDRKSVAVFDGEQLFCYDGRDSATVFFPDNRATTCLAFDPRSLGISTGLFSDLTLEENLAYRSGSGMTVAGPGNELDGRATARIELFDRFSQTIRFDVERVEPYRVSYYSKTIPLDNGDGIYAIYATEAEYWPDLEETWIPRKLTMYTLDEGSADQRTDEVIVEFEKPEFVAGFDPKLWSVEGLSLPFGQPLVDLRIKERVGYWNGKALVKSPPEWTPPPTPKVQTPRLKWLVIVNLVALAVICAVFLARRRREAER